MASPQDPGLRSVSVGRTDFRRFAPSTRFLIRLSILLISIGSVVHPARAQSRSKDSTGIRLAASPYLSSDSWIYPLMERLIATGYVDDGALGLRPWTRIAVAGMIDRAERSGRAAGDPNAQEVLAVLHREFRQEIEAETSAQVRSDEVYVRSIGITGTPLRDGFHFGQTIWNDNGRPYGEGANAVAGGSISGSTSHFVIHARGEYQHAGSMPAYSTATQAFIARVDQLPFQAPRKLEQVAQFRLLEGYVGVSVGKVQLTLGKQNLYWGPSSSPMLFSNNAEPIYMGRIVQTEPSTLPWVFRYLGRVQWDAFMGALSGHDYPNRPYIHGQKISLMPVKNLELGFSRTVLFSGGDRPLTFRSFWRSFWSVGDNPAQEPGAPADVGDRRGGFDVSYRIPKLGMQAYFDGFSEDDPSPLAAMNRTAFVAGVYFAKLPAVGSKMDLRLEVPSSTLAANYRGQFFYRNGAYRNGYTNKGNLLGSWIGRDSLGQLVSTNYWFTPERFLTATYRHVTMDSRFIPGGGNIHDGRLGFTSPIARQLYASGYVQYERWNVPLLNPHPQQPVTIAFQLSFRPGVVFGGTRLNPGLVN